jgi:hypothetical protein
MTGRISSERQLGRLLAQQPNPAIGLNCVSLCDVEIFGESGVMIGMPHGRTASQNPQASRECVQNIAKFVNHLQQRA